MSNFANFRPAGLEDESDDDEFGFGNDYNLKNYDQHKTKVVTANATESNGSRGGFGDPVLKKNDSPQTVVQNGTVPTAQTDWKPKRHGAPKGRPVHQSHNSLAHSENNSIENGHNSASTKSSRKGKTAKPSCLQSDVLPVDDLRMAVMRNNITRVKECLQMGIDADTVFSTGWTSLMYAATYGKADSVSLLLEKGADPNFNKDCVSVLMIACSSTCSNESEVLKCVTMLLDKGADVNAYDRHHDTALINATKKGKVTVVKKLLECQANIDKQDNNGYTALMWSVRHNNLRMLQVLLEAGADYNKQTVTGEKAIDMASLNGFEKAEELLKAKVDPSVDIDVNSIVESAPMSLMSTEDTNVGTQPSISQPDDSNSLSMITLQGAGANEVYKHGELEVFLSGLDLADLIPKFLHHNIQFHDFLRTSDKQLQELGITKMSMRKRILDAIQDTHKKDWQTSSINVVQYNKPISCGDAVAMVTNIKRHASYISSSIGYITDQVKDNKDILAQAEEQCGAEELSIQSEEAITNVKFLYEELVVLRNFLTQAADRPQYKRADLIEPKLHHKKSSSWSTIRTILVSGTLCGVVYYKRETLVDGLSSLYNHVMGITSR